MAVDGLNSVEFGDYANNPGRVSQTLTTVPGQSYLISVWIAEQGGSNNTAGLQFGGTALEMLSNISNTTFTEYSYEATATSSSTVLTLVGGSDPWYVYFDNVSVVADVPEPAVWQLLVAGLLVLVALRQRVLLKGQMATLSKSRSRKPLSFEPGSDL